MPLGAYPPEPDGRPGRRRGVRLLMVVTAVTAALAASAPAATAKGPMQPFQEVAVTPVAGDAYFSAVPVRGVAAVAFDGSLTGVSADGGRVVLARIRSRIPARATDLAVLDGRTLRLVR